MLLTGTITNGQPGMRDIGLDVGFGQIDWVNNQTFTYDPGIFPLPPGPFSANDKVASSNPNFTAYRKTINGQELTLELYRPGSGNSELALTYASLARWSNLNKRGNDTDITRGYLAYGLETPRGTVAVKTGSANYAGIVYGAGANEQTNASYDITGTSGFAVDFSAQSISGTLMLRGTGTNGTPSIDFGRYDFRGAVGSEGAIARGNVGAGAIFPRFYGPDASEIAGFFVMVTPDGTPGAGTYISGVAAARRQ